MKKAATLIPVVLALAAASPALARADLNPIQDGLTDDVISPACRIGSLQSWQGRPCVIFEQLNSCRVFDGWTLAW